MQGLTYLRADFVHSYNNMPPVFIDNQFPFQGEMMQKMLQLDLKTGDDSSYAVDIRHTAVQYLNDLEKDRVYKSWPGSVQELMRPTFPGMLRHIAKNMFHLVGALCFMHKRMNV